MIELTCNDDMGPLLLILLLSSPIHIGHIDLPTNKGFKFVIIVIVNGSHGLLLIILFS